MYVNGKMRPVETIPGMGGYGEQRKMKERVNVRTFVNATMYP
jgi:hypothetical protein